MKTLSIIFWVLAGILSHLMCIFVSYGYCDQKWGAKYLCYSAPASIAFLWIIPFGIGIAVCIFLALFFHKRAA